MLNIDVTMKESIQIVFQQILVESLEDEGNRAELNFKLHFQTLLWSSTQLFQGDGRHSFELMMKILLHVGLIVQEEYLVMMVTYELSFLVSLGEGNYYFAVQG